jgi:hypothetical protein
LNEAEFGRFADDPQFLGSLEAFAAGSAADDLLEWAGSLRDYERRWLREDLRLVLAEPLSNGEPLDRREILDILAEYAELAGHAGPLVTYVPQAPAAYGMDIRQRDLRDLRSASPAVQTAFSELQAGFLASSPEDPEKLRTGQIKKMPDRALWQIDLPDGWRLRYIVDEETKTVHVVYLGPHPDGAADGRERAVLAALNRRRNER